jgi:hypothetical protein
VDEFALLSFEKEIFRYHSLFDSIHPYVHNISSRMYQMPIKKGSQRQTLWTDLLAEHRWSIQKLI